MPAFLQAMLTEALFDPRPAAGQPTIFLGVVEAVEMSSQKALNVRIVPRFRNGSSFNLAVAVACIISHARYVTFVTLVM